MQRREFLRFAGAASAALGLLPIGRSGWAATLSGAGGGKRSVTTADEPIWRNGDTLIFGFVTHPGRASPVHSACSGDGFDG